MQGFLNVFYHYARPELMVLIPVLFVFTRIVSVCVDKKEQVLLIVCAISIVLCGIYTFATIRFSGVTGILLGVFSSITQGMLYAGASLIGSVLSAPSDDLASSLRLIKIRKRRKK